MSFHPFYRRDIKVNEASLHKEDLKRLFSIIQAQLDKAVDIQIANTNPDLYKDFEAVKEEIKRVFIIYYSINKKMGDAVSGYNAPDFASSAFPEQIETLFLSTKSTFELHAGFAPRNWMEMLIDFKRSRVSIDFITLPSNPTENGTGVNISGLEEPWVIETYDKLREFFDARSNNRIYIHRSGIYDAFLFTIIMPLFLYAFYRFEVENPTYR